jgi:hypothetical protein
VARRGIYDNMKTAVDKVKKGKGRIVNARFAAMCAHYLFDPDFCNVASGWEKGVVEKNVQDSRRRIWIERAKRASAASPNSTPGWPTRCRRCGRTCATPSTAVQRGRDAGARAGAPDAHARRRSTATWSAGAGVSTCLVSVARNRYSVPCELAGQMVSTRLYPGRRGRGRRRGGRGQPRAAEQRRDQTVYDWQHYIPLVQRKPGALRNGAPFADMPEPLQRLRRRCCAARAATG